MLSTRKINSRISPFTNKTQQLIHFFPQLKPILQFSFLTVIGGYRNWSPSFELIYIPKMFHIDCSKCHWKGIIHIRLQFSKKLLLNQTYIFPLCLSTYMFLSSHRTKFDTCLLLIHRLPPASPIVSMKKVSNICNSGQTHERTEARRSKKKLYFAFSSVFHTLINSTMQRSIRSAGYVFSWHCKPVAVISLVVKEESVWCWRDNVSDILTNFLPLFSRPWFPVAKSSRVFRKMKSQKNRDTLHNHLTNSLFRYSYLLKMKIQRCKFNNSSQRSERLLER